eukprot:COSAG05_NODE_5275_length_1217_cov_1.924866_3_plen_147_part_00
MLILDFRLQTLSGHSMHFLCRDHPLVRMHLHLVVLPLHRVVAGAQSAWLVYLPHYPPTAHVSRIGASLLPRKARGVAYCAPFSFGWRSKHKIKCSLATRIPATLSQIDVLETCPHEWHWFDCLHQTYPVLLGASQKAICNGIPPRK